MLMNDLGSDRSLLKQELRALSPVMNVSQQKVLLDIGRPARISIS